jgi:asparagine synthase (glutamine-hydrolysing)
MRAIAGIIRFDAQTVENSSVTCMLAQMQHADASSAALWQQGPVALGSVRLHARAAAPAPLPPRVGAWPIGHLHLVFDGHLDNRATLLSHLGLDAHTPLTDDMLVLACYAKWGQATPAHLVGDYAFALWDEHAHTLFCARDHFGLRPLYTYHGPNCFLFASELRALLAHPAVPRHLNHLRIGLHLSVQVPDNHLTFFTGIERLRPAHSLCITQSGTRAQQHYWDIANIRELHLPSDQEYAEAFRELFTEAVACRIPAERPLGALLSGGLDSTSVTTVLHQLIGAGHDQTDGNLLHTFSAIFDQTPECDERDYIAATLQLGGITPHFVSVETTSPLAQIDDMLTAMGEPFAAPTLYIAWNLYRSAQQAGIRVVFDGMDGDTAVHHGDAYLAELARTGQWADFFKLAQAIAERKKLPLVNSLMLRYGEPYLTSLASQWQWHKLHRELRTLSPYASLSTRRLFYKYVRTHSLRPLTANARRHATRLLGVRAQPTPPKGSVVSRALLHQTDLLAYIRADEQTAHPPATSRQEHYQQLTTPLLPQIFEISMRAAQTFGIEVRQPFTDRRLIEFCYALPPQQKVAAGWTRNILRRGLAGTLPEAIRLRGDKAVNSPAVTKAFLGQDAAHLEHFVNHQAQSLEEFIDLPRLQAAHARYRADGNAQDEMVVWQAVTLGRWLQQNATIPVTGGA